MARIVAMIALVLASLLALSIPVAASPPAPCPSHDPCGVVQITPCGVATAEGAGAGLVEWRLVVTNAHGPALTEATGPAAALFATLACATSMCWSASLYGNGVLVDQMTLCF